MHTCILNTSFFLLVLSFAFDATSATTDSNDQNRQPPLRVYEYQAPANNGTNNSDCAVGQCPDARTPPRNLPPPRTEPLNVAPETATPTEPIKLQRPASRHIPLLPSTSNNIKHEPQQLLLYFPDISIASNRIREISQKYQLQPAQRTPLNALGGEIVLYLSEHYDLQRLKEMLTTIAPEAVVEFNINYHEADGPRQYFSSKIHMDTPTKVIATTPIGIIDTDVADLPALSLSKKTRKNFVSPTNTISSTAHGTAIALLIAGKDEKNDFYGVAPGSPLYIASIMRKTGSRNNTNSLILAQAIDWLVGEDVRVINLSIGGPNDAIMARIFKKLSNFPIVVVAAAGNDGAEAPPSFPAAYPGVLAVTATNANNHIYKHANQGHYITIAAPGEDIWAPNATGGKYFSGTSFSAALVSGASSLLLTKTPKLTPSETQQRLCQQALDLGKAGNDEVFGCGLLQSHSY